jgi:hypothetical protein
MHRLVTPAACTPQPGKATEDRNQQTLRRPTGLSAGDHVENRDAGDGCGRSHHPMSGVALRPEGGPQEKEVHGITSDAGEQKAGGSGTADRATQLV